MAVLLALASTGFASSPLLAAPISLVTRPPTARHPPTPRRAAPPAMSPLADAATVCVIGASGAVGNLVALRLSERYRVRGLVRTAASARPSLPASVELRELNLLTASAEELEAAVRGAAAVVMCTGTTAYPTRAWLRSREDDDLAGAVLRALFDRRAAVRLLDEAGYNTPNNVDDAALVKVLDAWGKAGGVRERFVLMSSIGVQRREQMPFPILNLCGVLDAKASGEAALVAAAEAGGFAYTIVRPGQMLGGPYEASAYAGSLFALEKDSGMQEVVLARGDTLVGDVLRSTVAEVIAQTLETGSALNMDFSVVNEKGNPPSNQELRERLAAL
ncbi:hypothetical protein AB1Y20_008754 [Prymnesium parvum]|uniref:NAD(P)-binding domain-containing protein n=1 Tax=Prymnesium parvum TaxID=97485 RepID=A0AB34ISD9_PRYPA